VRSPAWAPGEAGMETQVGPGWQEGVRAASSLWGAQSTTPVAPGEVIDRMAGEHELPAEVGAPWGTVTSSSPDTLPEHCLQF
jgi:hypothetical protein